MDIQINLELILLIGVIFFTLVFVYYFIKPKPSPAPDVEPILLDYAKSFLPLILIILILRSFVAEPFRIPSGSMIPTLEVGDFIVVKKYSYALRLPVFQTKIISTGKPKRGDVVVFRYPPEPKVNYIKRLVGLPGDHIEWTADKKLIINGKAVAYNLAGKYPTQDRVGQMVKVDKYQETFSDSKPHSLIVFPGSSRAGEWDVPDGHYFMMGDNRDNSSDSRFWGFVPEDNLIGKASMVWMHWNWFSGGDGFQSDRVGTTVN